MTELPPVALGTYDNTDPEQCAESVRTALDLGYRHVDTAQSYGNETAVGTGLERASVPRSEVVVATKVAQQNLAYDDVIASTKASRERLGIDTIDLLYVHWPLQTYDAAETLGAFADLRSEGVIDHIGVSNFTPALLDEARTVLDAPIVAHQVEMHPLLQQPRLREYSNQHGIQFVAYSPLAKGRVLQHPVLREIAEEYDSTPAQVSLAWLLAKEVAIVPKATGRAHIEENWAARQLTLDPEAIARIDAISETVRVVDPPDAPWNQ